MISILINTKKQPTLLVEVLQTYHDGYDVRLPDGTLDFIPLSGVVAKKPRGGNRPGAGRKKSEDPKGQVHSYMPEYVVAALDRLADEEGKSVSSLILEIIKARLFPI